MQLPIQSPSSRQNSATPQSPVPQSPAWRVSEATDSPTPSHTPSNNAGSRSVQSPLTQNYTPPNNAGSQSVQSPLTQHVAGAPGSLSPRFYEIARSLPAHNPNISSTSIPNPAQFDPAYYPGSRAFYVVTCGITLGIFDDWDNAKMASHGYTNGSASRFNSWDAAVAQYTRVWMAENCQFAQPSANATRRSVGPESPTPQRYRGMTPPRSNKPSPAPTSPLAAFSPPVAIRSPGHPSNPIFVKSTTSSPVSVRQPVNKVLYPSARTGPGPGMSATGTPGHPMPIHIGNRPLATPTYYTSAGTQTKPVSSARTRVRKTIKVTRDIIELSSDSDSPTIITPHYLTASQSMLKTGPSTLESIPPTPGDGRPFLKLYNSSDEELAQLPTHTLIGSKSSTPRQARNKTPKTTLIGSESSTPRQTPNNVPSTSTSTPSKVTTQPQVDAADLTDYEANLPDYANDEEFFKLICEAVDQASMKFSNPSHTA